MDGICNQYWSPLCRLAILSVCALAVSAGICRPVLAQITGPPAASSDATEGIILLKNGQLMMGQAFASVDRTIVETKSGSRIFLKTDDIRFICNSWREAWEYQRDAVNIDDPRELAKLMEWCLRHHLLVEARQVFDRLQLTKVRASDLDHFHRMVVSAEKGYEISLRRKLELNTNPVVANPPGTLPMVAGAKIQDENIRPTSFVSESAGSVMNPVVSAETLDRFSERVPGAALDSWRRDVEPLLLRSCSNAGCHGPSDKTLPLMSIGSDHHTPLRMSQQNMYWTARQLLDGETGCESFLNSAGTMHGGQAAAAFRPDSNEFARIQKWAQDFCAQADAEMIDFANAPKSGSSSPGSIQFPGSVPETITAPRELPQRSVEPDVPTIPSIGKPELDFPKIPDLANAPGQFVPVDEFDPQIFNRFLRDSEATSHSQARSLGLPDLQLLIGKEKTPEK